MPIEQIFSYNMARTS